MTPSAIKIAIFFWLRDKLVSFAMRRPWSTRLSHWEEVLTMRLDALGAEERCGR
uniref:Uncharacterized protein n=1 Tax=Desulfovibrio sp. U5L TaxID=596152 RepID=I2Q5E3_9BACT